MCAGWPATGLACCRCSRTPACRNWSTARPTIRSAPAELADLAGALRRGGRRQPDRRLLRHQRAAHRRAGRDAAPAAAAFRPAPVARKPVWVPVGRQPVPGGAAAPGERLLRHRRTLQRQRLEEVARGCRRSTTGTAASRWAASRSAKAPTRSISAPPSSAATRWREMTEVIRRFTALGERAAGDRQHRNAGDRGGAEAARRQADHQLDQLRGRREARHRSAEAGEAVRRRGDRADHRRDRHGEDRRGQAADRAAAGGFRLQPARPAAVGPADRSADLHHRHRQRGRPQAGAMDAGGHRARSATSSPTSRSSSACRISASG